MSDDKAGPERWEMWLASDCGKLANEDQIDCDCDVDDWHKVTVVPEAELLLERARAERAEETSDGLYIACQQLQARAERAERALKQLVREKNRYAVPGDAAWKQARVALEGLKEGPRG